LSLTRLDEPSLQAQTNGFIDAWYVVQCGHRREGIVEGQNQETGVGRSPENLNPVP
jgi:hypothetical protein